MSSSHPPIEVDMQVLGGRVSIKGSNTETAMNPSGEEHVAPVTPITMGLYVQGDNCTHLVSLIPPYYLVLHVGGLCCGFGPSSFYTPYP